MKKVAAAVLLTLAGSVAAGMHEGVLEHDHGGWAPPHCPEGEYMVSNGWGWDCEPLAGNGLADLNYSDCNDGDVPTWNSDFFTFRCKPIHTHTFGAEGDTFGDLGDDTPAGDADLPYPLGYISNPWMPVYGKDDAYIRRYIDPMHYTQDVADRYTAELEKLGCENPSYPQWMAYAGHSWVYVTCN